VAQLSLSPASAWRNKLSSPAYQLAAMAAASARSPGSGINVAQSLGGVASRKSRGGGYVAA